MWERAIEAAAKWLDLGDEFRLEQFALPPGQVVARSDPDSPTFASDATAWLVAL